MATNKDKATTEQQIEWHLEHQKHCSCAPIPKKLWAEMGKRNIQGDQTRQH